jgi:hypothetical protein
MVHDLRSIFGFTEKCQSERTDSKEQDDGHGDIYTVCKL